MNVFVLTYSSSSMMVIGPERSGQSSSWPLHVEYSLYALHVSPSNKGHSPELDLHTMITSAVALSSIS